ncbi:hypothetical protein ACFL0Q_02525 [Thermodesulfobacteriota bacterium]
MRNSPQPVRTTVCVGLLYALVYIPMTTLLGLVVHTHLAVGLTLWGYLAFYGLLLGRWSSRSPLALVFSLLMPLAGVFFFPSPAVYLFLMLGSLTWMRSGVCFADQPGRRLLLELLTCLGGAGLVAFFPLHTRMTWALGIWMFFIVQALYFVYSGDAQGNESQGSPRNPFARSMRTAEEILSNASGNTPAPW